MAKTLIVIVLDQSGSLHDKKSDIIIGYNALIEEQKKCVENGEVLLVKFNSKVSKSDVENLKDIKPLTVNDYVPDDMTALFDGVGLAIDYADVRKNKEDRVCIVIFTYGAENSSKLFTKQNVWEKINDSKRKDWKFLYYGEQPEKWCRESGMDVADCCAFDHANPWRTLLSASTTLGAHLGQGFKQNFL